MAERSLTGLYASTLFRLKPKICEQLNSAIELGRSFIRREDQRDPSALMLLWKGIGRFVVDHPQYKYLFGPVSISQQYHTISIQMMVAYLKAHQKHRSRARLVRPRRPVQRNVAKPWPALKEISAGAGSIDELSTLVSQLEPDATGVPVLLKQYVKLGGDFLGFNVDPYFSNAIDGLVLVDLTETKRTVLNRYMGKDGAASFLSRHFQSEIRRGNELEPYLQAANLAVSTPNR